MLNKVIIQGRLVAEPELRHTAQGTAVANVRMAVAVSYTHLTLPTNSRV